MSNNWAKNLTKWKLDLTKKPERPRARWAANIKRLCGTGWIELLEGIGEH